MAEGFYLNQIHKGSINIKENTRHALADDLKTQRRNREGGMQGTKVLEDKPWQPCSEDLREILEGSRGQS